jgi:hypothetical protein
MTGNRNSYLTTQLTNHKEKSQWHIKQDRNRNMKNERLVDTSLPHPSIHIHQKSTKGNPPINYQKNINPKDRPFIFHSILQCPILTTPGEIPGHWSASDSMST